MKVGGTLTDITVYLPRKNYTRRGVVTPLGSPSLFLFPFSSFSHFPLWFLGFFSLFPISLSGLGFGVSGVFSISLISSTAGVQISILAERLCICTFCYRISASRVPNYQSYFPTKNRLVPRRLLVQKKRGLLGDDGAEKEREKEGESLRA